MSISRQTPITLHPVRRHGDIIERVLQRQHEINEGRKEARSMTIKEIGELMGRDSLHKINTPGIHVVIQFEGDLKTLELVLMIRIT